VDLDVRTKTDKFDELFHEEAVFVHMGGNMTKEHELNVIFLEFWY